MTNSIKKWRGVAGTLALAMSLMAPIPGSADTASGLQQVQLYAQEFVGTCTQLALTDADRAATLAQLGFKTKLFGSNKRVGTSGTLTTTGKPNGICALGFSSVGPVGSVMRSAIDAQLAAKGYRTTGQIVSAPVGNTLAGSGAATREIYSNGKYLIALEQGGRNDTLSSFNLQRYVK